MEGRTIDVKVISAMDLKKVKMFGMEQKCYAVAYIYPSVKQSTDMDHYGGVNPVWNSKRTLTCYEAHLHPPSSASYAITVEIFSHSSFGHDKLVGTARLPLQDIPEGIQGNEKARGDRQPFETSCTVILPSGEAQGTVNISVKVGKKRILEPYEDPSAPRLTSYSGDPHQASSSSGKSGNFPPSVHDSGSSSSAAPVCAPMSSAHRGDYPPAPSERDVVTGYPVQGYPAGPMPFDPLRQPPAQMQQQYVQQQYVQDPTQELYPPGMLGGRRRGRRRGQRRRGGPIHLGIGLLQNALMGMELKPQQQRLN